MITLFRRIRERLIASGSITKYLLYATGEILLVVIGILIALQVNNWNEERVRIEKEYAYLQEIRDNLVTDSLQIDRVVEFNAEKTAAIEEVIASLLSDKDPSEVVLFISDRMDVLPNFEFFFPTSVAFDNMISSESISLVRDRELRESLSLNYSNEGLFLGTQERTKQLARGFSDRALPYLFSKEVIDQFFDADSEYPTAGETGLKSDPQIIGDLFVMTANIEAQNALLQGEKEDITELIRDIDEYLSSF